MSSIRLKELYTTSRSLALFAAATGLNLLSVSSVASTWIGQQAGFQMSSYVQPTTGKSRGELTGQNQVVDFNVVTHDQLPVDYKNEQEDNAKG